MYNLNFDDNGREADYVPITASGRLNGSKLLVPVFKQVLTRHRDVAGNVPLVFFIDFPTDMMERYYGFSVKEKLDFWQMYVPEAYACGLYYAFHPIFRVRCMSLSAVTAIESYSLSSRSLITISWL